jgi:plasmid stabilization system protein ParE
MTRTLRIRVRAELDLDELTDYIARRDLRASVLSA